MDGYRIEQDSLGEMQVPEAALYGAQTARAVDNFPISGLRLSRPMLRALGLLKKHAAETNQQLGLLPVEAADAISRAAAEVVAGKLDEHFPVDIFQTGSGTSSNMNSNEVIANRAARLLELLAAHRTTGVDHQCDIDGRAGLLFRQVKAL